MLRFVVRRLLLLVPILLGLSILVFVWIRALPGSPAQALLGERATPETIAQINHQYGLDQPIYVQYWRTSSRRAQLRPRHQRSRRGRPVTDRDRAAFPGHDRAGARGDDLRDLDRHPARVLRGEALRRLFDHVSARRSRCSGSRSRSSSSALILKYIFAVRLGWLPSIGREISVLINIRAPDELLRPRRDHRGQPGGASGTSIKHLILPAIALGSIPLAIITRITRAAVLDVQNEDYVRTARAKGLRAAHRRPPARAAQRAAAGLDDHRPAGRACSSRARSSPRRCSRTRGSARWLQQAIFNRDYPVHPGRDPLPRGRRSSSSTCSSTSRTRSSTRGSGSAVDSMSIAEIEVARARASRPAAGGLWREAWRRLRRNPGAIVGFVLVGLFVFVAIFAPLLAPHDPREQDLRLIVERLLPGPVARTPGSASTTSAATSSRASSTAPALAR